MTDLDIRDINNHMAGTSTRPRAVVQVADAFTEVGIRSMLADNNIDVVYTMHEDVILVTDDPQMAGPRTVLIVDGGNGTSMRALETLFVGNLGAIVARSEPTQLPLVISSLATGLSSFPRELVVAASARPQIVDRHRRVLELIAAGLPNPRIAERLNLSEATIKRDISTLLRSFNCRSRAELASEAARLGFSVARR